VPLPLRYQWSKSNSNLTFHGWLERELILWQVKEEEKILQSATPTNTAREAITCTNVSCGWNIRGKGFCGLIRCCPGRNK